MMEMFWLEQVCCRICREKFLMGLQTRMYAGLVHFGILDGIKERNQ